MPELEKIAIAASRCRENGVACALATIVAASGSNYRGPGAHLLVTESGEMHGAISGGCLDTDLLEHARGVMARGIAKIVDYRADDDDLLFGTALGCGGELRVLLEPVTEALLTGLRLALEPARRQLVAIAELTAPMATTICTRPDAESRAVIIPARPSVLGGRFVQLIDPPQRLILIGASPEAVSICAIAATLGWRVVVCDHRAKLATAARFPAAREIVVAPVDELVDRSGCDSDSATVVMMHNYHHDLTLLRHLLQKRPRYLGILGSRRRTERLVGDLEAAGGVAAATALERLFAPTGLSLGAEAPTEIALSIVAEIQAVLAGVARPGFLRDKGGPIHDREQPRARVAIAVLAAGGSTRLGVPKQTVEIEGETLLRRAARNAADAGAACVFVMLGAGADRLESEVDGLGVTVVRNEEWESGLSSSVLAAVAAAGSVTPDIDAIMFALADQPRVEVRHLRRLLETFDATRAAVVASAYDEGGGVPAIFRRDLFDELRSLGGDAGAREVIRRMPERVISVGFDPGAEADVDTAEDVEKLRASCSIDDPRDA